MPEGLHVGSIQRQDEDMPRRGYMSVAFNVKMKICPKGLHVGSIQRQDEDMPRRGYMSVAFNIKMKMCPEGATCR
jgi:hypothetical protein